MTLSAVDSQRVCDRVLAQEDEVLGAYLLPLHRHHVDVMSCRSGESYVLSTGTGSGKR